MVYKDNSISFWTQLALATIVALCISSNPVSAQQDAVNADSLSADSLRAAIIKGFMTENIRTSKNVPSEASGYVRKGERLFYQGPQKYEQAIEQFKMALHIAPNNAYINYKIGECYLLGNRDKIRSVTYLEKAYNQNKRINDKILLHLGRSFHLNMDLDRAILEYNNYIAAYSKQKRFKEDTPADSTIRSVHKFIAECETGKQLLLDPKRVFVYNLGEKINSEFPDYDPFLLANDTILIFTSRRESTKGGGRADIDAHYYEDVFTAVKKGDTWEQTTEMTRKFNKRTNNAVVGISGDGLTMFMYRDTERGNLYETKLVDGEWTKPKGLKFINTEHRETSASLSKDGNTMYYVSDKPGGLGGGDIYVIKKDSAGEWSESKNIGGVVNTELDEGRVFLSWEGTLLYFSSKGHNTMGGYDIFVSEQDSATGEWLEPTNIGYPINSVDDDISFSVTPTRAKGYYSSIKPNGYGSKDIYMVAFLDFLKPVHMETQETAVTVEMVSVNVIVPTEAIEVPDTTLLTETDSAQKDALVNLLFLEEGVSDLAYDREGSKVVQEVVEINLNTRVAAKHVELNNLKEVLQSSKDSVLKAGIEELIEATEKKLVQLEKELQVTIGTEAVADTSKQESTAEAAIAEERQALELKAWTDSIDSTITAQVEIALNSRLEIPLISTDAVESYIPNSQELPLLRKEIQMLQATIKERMNELTQLEVLLAITETPEEIVHLVEQIQDRKKELGLADEQLLVVIQTLEEMGKDSTGIATDKSVISLNAQVMNKMSEIADLEKELDKSMVPDNIVELVIIIDNKKLELARLEASLEQEEELEKSLVLNLRTLVQNKRIELTALRDELAAASSEEERARIREEIATQEKELEKLEQQLAETKFVASVDDRDGDGSLDNVDQCPDKAGPTYNRGCPLKLYLLGPELDTLGFAYQDKDGVFAFGKLKSDESHLFMLEIFDVDKVEEVKVKYTDETGNIRYIFVNKEDSKYFRYNYMPYTLHLINENRDTLLSSVQNDKGVFVYKKLNDGESQLFVLEGPEADLIDEVKIEFTKESGIVENLTAVKKDGEQFKYDPPIATARLEVENDSLESAMVEDKKEEEQAKEPVPLFTEQSDTTSKTVLSDSGSYLLDNILFEFDRSNIQEESFTELDKLALLLKAKPLFKAEIVGHTDHKGPASYNLHLSQRRASAVIRYLVGKGTSPNRLLVKGYGESRPIEPNTFPDGTDNPEGRAKNRRTEITIFE